MIITVCMRVRTCVCESVALLVARRSNNRKVAGLRPTKVVCITVLTDNRRGELSAGWPQWRI